jgi:phosphoribosyl-AMP cyclohydrolase
MPVPLHRLRLPIHRPEPFGGKESAMPAFDIASLRFDAQGLIPAIAQARDGHVLMLAWMNAESLAATLATGEVTYWSRSRRELWRKGATSGHAQRLVELRLDCDRDTLLLVVDQTGPACHTGRRSCFYTAVRDGEEVVIADPVGSHAG